MRVVPFLVPVLALGLLALAPATVGALGVTVHADVAGASATVVARPLSTTSVHAAPVPDPTGLLGTRDASIATDSGAREAPDGADAASTTPGEALTASTWTRDDAARAAAIGPGLWLALTALSRFLGATAFGGLGLLPGYARITRADVLDNAHRDRVYGLLRERPGLSASDLQTITGLGWGTVTYHLDRLQRTGLVTSERSGLSRRYYPAADVPPRERKALAALERPQLSALARHVLTSPGLAQGELAQMAGLTKSAAAKQLAALEEAGLVQREREGRTARVKPTDTLLTLTT